jgi:hypothetical protein
MNSTHDTLAKLLSKTIPVSEKDESPAGITRSTTVVNIGLALTSALLLAFVLISSFPFLEKGDMSSRNITAPYTMYIEYPGPDQTVFSYKVNKGEVIVEAGHRVSERPPGYLRKLGAGRASATGNTRTWD